MSTRRKAMNTGTMTSRVLVTDLVVITTINTRAA
jgi:hypothetical protein